MYKFLVVIDKEYLYNAEIPDVGASVDEKELRKIEKTCDIYEEYPRRDCFCEGVLGTFEASSCNEAISTVSKEYEISKTILKAYQLA